MHADMVELAATPASDVLQKPLACTSQRPIASSGNRANARAVTMAWQCASIRRT